MEQIKILVADDESRMRKLVRDFLSRQNYFIIEAADGEPHFIAQSFPVWSEGINLGFFAVQTDGDIYLPVVPLFDAFQTKWDWNAAKQEISIKHRTVSGIQKGTEIYLKADQLEKALRLNGIVNGAGQFELTDMKKK